MLLYFTSSFLLAFFILVPLFEWLMHRHTMHTKRHWKLFADLFRYHDRVHHIAFDSYKRYTMPEQQLRRRPKLMEGLSFNGWFMLGLVGIHAGVYLLALLPLLPWVHWPVLLMIFLGLVSGSAAFGPLQIKYHYWYHAQDGFGYRVIAKLPIIGHYFRYVAEHHRKHHEDTTRYLNTLVPTIDLLIAWWRKLTRPPAPLR